MAREYNKEPIKFTVSDTCLSVGSSGIYGYCSIKWHQMNGYEVMTADIYLQNGQQFPNPLTLKEGESIMKKCIEEAYPNETANANLVEKHSLALGITDTFICGLTLKANSSEVLDEAKRLEAVEVEKE